MALRNGNWEEIAAKDLVIGDIVSVKLGNIIPADIKLAEGEYLTVDQSTLTGESLPVNKKKDDIAYSGTGVKKGKMTGVVVATGTNTFFGKTAMLVKQAKTTSHFQEAVLKIGNFLILISFTICIIIAIISIHRSLKTHSLMKDLPDIIIFTLVLIVAGIPIAMPAVLSATLAIGANKLAKMKAIVSKLTAIEELSSMDILCSDKTGTLTKNELTIKDIKLFDAKDNDEVLNTAYLTCESHSKDAIENAISANIKNKDMFKDYKQLKFTPFDPTIKRSEAVIQTPDNKEMLVIKGAPQVIVDLCNLDEAKKQSILNAIDDYAKKGFRTLGICKKEDNNMRFLGLIALFDPPRDDTKDTLQKVKDMGVHLKMVTGDHEAIAVELAKHLNIGSNIISVANFAKNNPNVSEEKKEQLIESADGFAEVFPEHKFEIVKALQRKKHIVGMTGDGVNDSPALKQADIGIAVDGSADAAKQSADLVLTEPGFNVIHKAIEEARQIFGRMKSYALYRITETCRLLLFISASIIIFHNYPLSAIMIILIALLNDIPIMMIAYDHMRCHSVPVTWNLKEIITISSGIALAGVISTFGLYWMGDYYWFNDAPDKLAKLSTLAFMGILCGGNLTIYLTRNVGSILQRPLPEIKFLLATLFSQLVGTLLTVYGIKIGKDGFIGIGWKYVLYTWVYILIWFILSMFVKEFLYRMIGYKKNYVTKVAEKTNKPMNN